MYTEVGKQMATDTAGLRMMESPESGVSPNEGELRLQSIFDSINDALFVHDVERDRILDVNARMCELYGCTREQALSNNIKRFSTGEEPYTMKKAETYLRLAADGKPQVFEWHAKTWQGTPFWVEIGLRVAQINGQKQVLATVRDVSDRKRAEQEVRDSQAMLQLVLDSIPVRVHWKDLNSIYRGGNKIFATDAELASPEDLVGKTDDDLPWHQYAPMYQERDRQVIRSGVPLLNYEQPRAASDGSIRWLLQSKVPFRNERGGTIGVLSVYEDITQRKADEEALRISERQYRELVENVNSIILHWSRNGEILFLNRFGLRFFGYQPEEVIGKHVVGLLVPESDEEGKDLRGLMDDITKNPEAFECNVNENMVKGGLRVWIAWTNRLVLDDKGQVAQILSVGNDITEQRRAEEQVRLTNEQLLVRNRVNAACASSLDLHVIMDKVLDEVLSSTGLEGAVFYQVGLDGSLSFYSERGFLGGAGEATRQVLQEAGPCLCDACLKDRQTHVEVMKASPNEKSVADRLHEISADWNASFPVVQGDTCVGVLCVFNKLSSPLAERHLKLLEAIAAQVGLAVVNARLHQVTESYAGDLEKRVDERTRELASAVEGLKEVDRLKSEFLATMSHELRTPLNSIIGFTGILHQGMAGPVNEVQTKQLGIIYESAKHLLTLINDLLDLSRIEAGRVVVDARPFEFQKVAADVVEVLRPLAEPKGLKIRAELPDKIIRMWGDSKRCYQVLLNLANNAVKFTDQGEVVIRAEAKDGRLRVEVRDTGIGIKPGQFGLLFEAFRQLDGSARRIYEGTGLGLHLCRKILSLMHGEIGVESEFGNGSIFWFTLPLELPKQENA